MLCLLRGTVLLRPTRSGVSRPLRGIPLEEIPDEGGCGGRTPTERLAGAALALPGRFPYFHPSKGVTSTAGLASSPPGGRRASISSQPSNLNSVPYAPEGAPIAAEEGTPTGSVVKPPRRHTGHYGRVGPGRPPEAVRPVRRVGPPGLLALPAFAVVCRGLEQPARSLPRPLTRWGSRGLRAAQRDGVT